MPGDLTTEGLVEKVASAILRRRGIPYNTGTLAQMDAAWEDARAALSALVEAAGGASDLKECALVLEDEAAQCEAAGAPKSADTLDNGTSLLRALAGATSDGGRG